MGSIRLFLAFAVLMSHAGVCEIEFIGGHVAVQTFLIISGFYMSLILAQKYKECSVFVFYTNRLLRLFPTYLVVLLVSLVALCVFDVGLFTDANRLEKVFTRSLFMAVFYFWTNIAIVGQDILFLLGIDAESYSFYWDPNGMASLKGYYYILVPQAWSLSMELYFYLLAPFILRLRVDWIAFIFVLSLGLRLLIVSKGPEYDLLARRCFPAELCLFLLGSLSYFLFGLIRGHKNKYSLGLISWTTLVAVLIFYEQIDKSYALILLAFASFVSIPFIFDLSRKNRIDRFLGNMSYPIYMVHFLIIAALEGYMEEYSLFVLLPLVFSASLLLYYGIETPIDCWRQRRVSTSKFQK